MDAPNSSTINQFTSPNPTSDIGGQAPHNPEMLNSYKIESLEKELIKIKNDLGDITKKIDVMISKEDLAKTYPDKEWIYTRGISAVVFVWITCYAAYSILTPMIINAEISKNDSSNIEKIANKVAEKTNEILDRKLEKLPLKEPERKK